MKEIYLIRHAQSTMNVEMKYSGITDCDLSEKGYEQTKILREKMKMYNIQQCYASPLKRAYLTASSFFENPIKINDLHEMNFGDVEGKTFKEVENEYPNLVSNMMKIKSDLYFPNGESQVDFRKRIKSIYDEILINDKNDSIAIVSHSCVIRAIISYEVLGNYELNWKMNIDNCSITKLEKHRNNTILSFLNR